MSDVASPPEPPPVDAAHAIPTEAQGASRTIEIVRSIVDHLFRTPTRIGTLTLPPTGLAVLGAIGAVFLLVDATARWATPSDEHAYLLAGRHLLDGMPLYDPTATPVTPYAFWYPPIVAQVMAPVTAILSSGVFTLAWTVLILGCVWWLAGSRPLAALALIAFPPVAVELWFRNVHLVLAVLIVLAIRRSPLFYIPGAAIKFSPALGIVYLGARRRWREAALVVLVGTAVLAISVLVSPEAWRAYIDVLRSRGPTDMSGFLPIPYVVRLLAGVGLAVVAGRLRPELGEPLLVIAIVVALPTLWFAALATLAALVPILRSGLLAPQQPQADHLPAAALPGASLIGDP